jgi:hypothetical protein
VLVEWGVVEQRYKTVSEMFDGAMVIDVARRNRGARQPVQESEPLVLERVVNGVQSLGKRRYLVLGHLLPRSDQRERDAAG